MVGINEQQISNVLDTLEIKFLRTGDYIAVNRDSMCRVCRGATPEESHETVLNLINETLGIRAYWCGKDEFWVYLDVMKLS